jgi:hypothetical protein
MLGDFNGTVDILKPLVADESSSEVIDDIRVKRVILVYLKTLVSRELNGFLASQHS